MPATLAQSDFLPERLPFDEPFDLAYAFSVFTHLSEAAHERCLAALHAGLRPGGILVVTIRPPAYLDESPLMASVRDRAADPYIFAPHVADPHHPQYAGPRDALRRDRDHAALRARALGGVVRAAPRRPRSSSDIHQVALTLRRRG